MELDFSKLTSSDITAVLVVKEYETTTGWKQKKFLWSNPSEEEKNISIGDRVLPAGESFSDFFQVKEIKEVGAKYFPDGGYICTTATGASRAFDLDAIIKHPGLNELKEKRQIKRKKRK